MKKSKAKKNVVVGFTGQLIILLLGMVFPRVILKNYGSDANGLISTITQIFSYMALLEAGIRQAAKNELFKCIAKKDEEQISVVATTAKRYFQRVTVLYGIGVIILSVMAPVFVVSNLDKEVIFFAAFFEGMAGVLSFYFVQTPSSILSAFGEDYVNTTVEVFNKGISYLVRIGLATVGASLFLLQFSYCIITIAKVIFYVTYFRRKYKWINFKAGKKKKKLRDRNAYVINELAWTIFSSTDNIILSTFVSTKMASVYVIYNMIFSALNTLLNAVYTSINYLLGQAFHENIKKYEILHDNFTSIFLGGMTILMSIAYILILPFISIYTKGVSDINYIYAALPVFFCLIRILSWSRYVTGNLTGLAGYAKQTSYISMLEAFMNIFISIVLVQKMGIMGVLIGSTIALPVKVIYCAYISDKKVMNRSCKKTIVIYGLNYLFFFSIVFASRFIKLRINTFYDLIFWGVIITVVIGIAGGTINMIANPNLLKWLTNSYLRKKSENKSSYKL